jgi:hypothetical protein
MPPVLSLDAVDAFLEPLEDRSQHMIRFFLPVIAHRTACGDKSPSLSSIAVGGS